MPKKILEPKTLIQIVYSREPKFIYWIGDNPDAGNFSAEPFQQQFHEGFVIIFEAAANELGAIKRVVSKKQFDDEQAKKAKIIQEKVEETATIPKGPCGIVAEYAVE